MGDTNSSPLNMDTVFLPTPSLSSETLPLPTPSPDSYTWATPTPSPGTQPSKTTEKNDKPRTSPTNRRNDTPTPWTANGRNDTHTPRTTEHNGNSTLSITAEVSKSTTTTTTAGHISILPVTSKKHDLSKTAESGAKTASINFYLVIIYGLMKHLYLALLCAVYLVNDVDPSRTNEPDPTPSPVRDKDLEPTLRSPGVTDQPTPSPSGNSGQHQNLIQEQQQWDYHPHLFHQQIKN
ncbi:unnamed protein product [Mytilus edulis]|uniref:Uncharacterized protein n=1 Tax=Mytilus edulis TaxID=6550 RepID=A0A8S3VEB0_MYTED|nr:unnamed protein product [Mytilus edulis]